MSESCGGMSCKAGGCLPVPDRVDRNTAVRRETPKLLEDEGWQVVAVLAATPTVPHLRPWAPCRRARSVAMR